MCVGGGGGGTLTFSSYVGLGPAFTVCRQKIFYFFATQRYSLSVHLPLEKTLKYIEKTPKTRPILS